MPRLAPANPRCALEPQRRPGKLRVAALLRAGAEVIAERGFEAATMADIAARAQAPIGSLYRFFPNKEVLAESLVRHYLESIDAVLEEIDWRPETASVDAFAVSLLDALPQLRGEMQSAIVALLEARGEFAARREEFSGTIRRHVVRMLRLRNPRLAAEDAESIAVVLVQNMKAMKGLDPERDAGAIAELRAMTRLYLQARLGA